MMCNQEIPASNSTTEEHLQLYKLLSFLGNALIVSKTSFVFATGTLPDASRRGINIIQGYYNDTCISLSRFTWSRRKSSNMQRLG